jgi:hypothetical protein
VAARNDFLCEQCGHHAEYWATRATAPSHCGQTMIWAPTRSAALDAKESFQETTIDSGDRVFKVDSLHAMRRIERETEQMARNGEGQPLVWRDYSQNRSNFDQHTLAKSIDRPVTGYAEGTTTGVDGTKFKKGVGDQVTSKHGTI